jgi:hypothetical protein
MSWRVQLLAARNCSRQKMRSVDSWLGLPLADALSDDDILHYQKIVAALAETMALMEQVDEVIEEYGGWPVE